MPFEFQSLIGKKALFKIVLKQYELELNNAYMIAKVNLDPEMIAKYGHFENKNAEEKVMQLKLFQILGKYNSQISYFF